MEITKKTVILIALLFTTINLSATEESFSYWDLMKNPLSKKNWEKAIDSVEDNITDIVESKKLDDTLHDLSEDIDIDTREEKIIDSIKDTLPDSFLTDSATFAVKAGSEMIRATLISDQELIERTESDLKKMDKNQTIANDNDQYYRDLQKIIKKIPIPKDLNLDVKVYLSNRYNQYFYIFSFPNGSIRVTSSMLELLTDDELLFIMAHEIAHLKENDFKSSYRKAHAMFALEKALKIDPVTGSISNGVLESVTSRMRKSQFQKEDEFEADEFAYEVLKKNGVDKKFAIDALEKLQYVNAPLLMMHPTAYERIKHLKDDVFPEE